MLSKNKIKQFNNKYFCVCCFSSSFLIFFSIRMLNFVAIAWPLNSVFNNSQTKLLFVHPIFSSFGFWYFGHFCCVIFFQVFFHLAHLALRNVNKDYVIFSYFHNFISKSDQKPKTKNGMNKTFCPSITTSTPKIFHL